MIITLLGAVGGHGGPDFSQGGGPLTPLEPPLIKQDNESDADKAVKYFGHVWHVDRENYLFSQ